MKKLAQKRIFFIFILLIIPTGQLAIDIYLPSMPDIAKSLQTETIFLQWSLIIFVFFFGLSELVIGAFSDFIGRKKLLCYGIGIYLFGTILCMLSFNIFIFMIGRFIQGMGIGASTVIPNAITADVFTGKELSKMVSYLTATYSAIPIIAPYIGGVIQEYCGWRANFLLLTTYTFFLLISIIIFLPETRKDKKGYCFSQMIKNYRCVITNYSCLALVTLMGLAFGIVIIFNVICPFLFMNSFKISPSQYGVIALLIGIAYMLGNGSNHKLSNYYTSDTVIVISIVLTFFSGVIMFISEKLFGQNIWGVIIPSFLAVTASGFVFSCCMTETLRLFPGLEGTVSAFLGFWVMFISTLFSSIIPILNINNKFLFATLIIFISLAYSFCFIFYTRVKLNKEILCTIK